MRQSTSEHTRKTNLRLQERQDAPRRRRGAHRDRPLTQEELLAEAKITAELNIRSLGKKMTENNHILNPVVPSCSTWRELLSLFYKKQLDSEFSLLCVYLYLWS